MCSRAPASCNSIKKRNSHFCAHAATATPLCKSLLPATPDHTILQVVSTLLLDERSQHISLVVTIPPPGRRHHAILSTGVPAIREIGGDNNDGADSALPCSDARVFRGVQVLALLLGDSPGNPELGGARTQKQERYPTTQF